MMRREFSSQHSASSTTTPTSTSSTASSTTTTSTTSASTTSTGSSSSPIHLRRNRRRASCRHASHGAASASIRRPCGPHAAKTSTLLARNPALAHKLHQMALPLSPLVQLTTGAVHPDFPTNVLQFWLLTDSQLEALASFYHQTVTPSGQPSPWAAQYPCPVRWRSDAPLECKRRRMGRFIGLRGCESPVVEAPVPPAAFFKTEDDIAREARLARLAADDEALRRKTAPGPFPR
ncbi:beta-xylosidase [Cordyceps fumosorosea ARSEF 2679]|uniref:Beta-xylosidase n=1 Tax=Cordyceps fumosorosea (strain ARSEF 2679) TaxID=1081104 RepID=A0A167XDP1_CORFA|nr:beta-xylosidase [Cordyceps fumosorosea ARSEF 2679]OAA64849.1 beta-xylosidase [Cordyceps fumosorosea ARSEF 2679]